MGDTAETEEQSALELVTFSCPECYLYAPLPPVSSYGHRAELWGVDHWNKVRRPRQWRCNR